ncbi:MAG: 30S ribosome-binding factor RbfA [Planctomycetota bacterium]|nr:30S ribosome-binding factor RbfA [Planctomycetota bacterium]
MATRRAARIGQAILETVSTSVLFEVRDPRVKNVTVLRVEVAPDLRSAKIFVSIMGDEQVRSLCLHGLASSRGYLQKRVADRLQTRYTPLLEFELDNAATANVVETTRILAELERERAQDADSNSDDDAAQVASEAEESES